MYRVSSLRFNDATFYRWRFHYATFLWYSAPLSLYGCSVPAGRHLRFKHATDLLCWPARWLRKDYLMRRTNLGNALCPVARSLDEIGDWWTLLIVRDACNGMSRFNEFHKSLGLAKNILSARLKTLVDNGVLEKRPGADGSARVEYGLTEKGRRLRVVLVAMRQWGEDYLFAHGEPMMVARDPANRPIGRLRLIDQDGRSLEPEEIIVTKGRKGHARGTSARARQRA